MVAAIEKTINGQPVTQTEFLRAICETLNKFPEDEGGRMADLVNAFGPEWDNDYGRQLMSNTLTTMRRRGMLQQVGDRKGYYRTTRTASRERGGVNSFEQTENTLVDVIRMHGGVMKMRDIADYLAPYGAERIKFQGDYNRGNTRRGKFHRTEWSRMPKEEREWRVAQGMAYKSHRSQLHNVIAKSLRIRRASDVPGWYSLEPHELLQIPQSSRNLSVLMGTAGRRLAKQAIQRGVAEARDDDWYAILREPIFRHLGYMIDAVRDLSGMTVEELVAMPVVHKAMERFRGYAQNVWQDMINYIRYSDEINDRMYEPSFDEVCRMTYQKYVEGESAVHLALKADFIEAVADVFKLDPNMLSFGVPVPRGNLESWSL